MKRYIPDCKLAFTISWHKRNVISVCSEIFNALTGAPCPLSRRIDYLGFVWTAVIALKARSPLFSQSLIQVCCFFGPLREVLMFSSLLFLEAVSRVDLNTWIMDGMGVWTLIMYIEFFDRKVCFFVAFDGDRMNNSSKEIVYAVGKFIGNSK